MLNSTQWLAERGITSNKWHTIQTAGIGYLFRQTVVCIIHYLGYQCLSWLWIIISLSLSPSLPLALCLSLPPLSLSLYLYLPSLSLSLSLYHTIVSLSLLFLMVEGKYILCIMCDLVGEMEHEWQ